MGKKYCIQILSFCLILFITLGNLLPASSYTHQRFDTKSLNDRTHKLELFDEPIKIISPLSTVPIFAKKGETFQILIESPNFNKAYAYLTTSYEFVIDEIWLNITKIEKINGTEILTAYVPPETPEELYNLTILIEIDTKIYSTTSPRAVKVLTDFPNTFTFAHVADFHLGDPRGFRESINQTIGWKSIKKCIEEINLLQPDFVIISGDLVYGQLYPFEYAREYEKCFEILQLFDVPTFLCPGNHDGYRRFREDGLEFWKDYFGPLYYSFNYGNYHFTAINSYDGPPHIRTCILFIPLNWGGYISDSQLNWIEHDLASHQNQSLFIFLHHSPLWESINDSLTGQHYLNRRELKTLINNYGVDMVLAGHIHRDTVTLIDNTIFITTTTPESEIRTDDGYWGFRMIDIKNKEIVSYNYKDPKYSIPTYRLNHTIWYSSTNGLTTIQNDLDINITVHIKFIMPLGEYSVDKGYITMIRNNDNMQEIYVISQVDKHNVQTITLSPQS